MNRIFYINFCVLYIDLYVPWDTYHELFCFFCTFYVSGTQDAEVTKSLLSTVCCSSMCNTFLVTYALPFFKKSDTYSRAWPGHFLLILVNPFTARKNQKSNFRVCGRNLMVWPFKWNLLGSTFTRCYSFFSILQSEFENFDKIWLKSLLGVKGFIFLWEHYLPGLLTIGLVIFKSNSPRKKIYLSQATGWYSFPALQPRKWKLI